ncbi:3'-5' exonuclease-like [Salvia miltiorrhiza]|uniref:3'-5' exonuclease-like n=1 Tax=Salvia miltiorrhiza TaxID=226208 RepID=UPI0025AD41E1|nr:3'-5' exonuclease-like [Salvia miltiorrhiza]
MSSARCREIFPQTVHRFLFLSTSHQSPRALSLSLSLFSINSTDGAAAEMAYHHSTPPSITIVDHELPYDTHNTYDVIFFGESVFTTLTCDPTIASQWISEVEAVHRRGIDQIIVGLDVEWRPSFNRYVHNPAATLQLCVGHRCLIFQLIHSPFVPPSLVAFLANPRYTFVGIGIAADLEKLEEDYEFGFNTNTVDLRELAAARYERRDLKNSGLKSLAALVLGKDVQKPKSITMSRWDNQWLTPTQVRYACVDAFVCFEIGRVLNASSPPAAAAAPPPRASALG